MYFSPFPPSPFPILIPFRPRFRGLFPVLSLLHLCPPFGDTTSISRRRAVPAAKRPRRRSGARRWPVRGPGLKGTSECCPDPPPALKAQTHTRRSDLIG